MQWRNLRVGIERNTMFDDADCFTAFLGYQASIENRGVEAETTEMAIYPGQSLQSVGDPFKNTQVHM